MAKDLRFEVPGVGALRLTHPAENVWRVQSAVNGAFDDFGAAQILARDLGEDMPLGALSFDVTIADGAHRLTAPDSDVTLTAAPFSLAAGSARVTGLASADQRITVETPLAEGEALFGGGERFNASNQRGKRIEVMSIDKWSQTEGNSYAPVPFVLSSLGHAFLLNRYERQALDLGAEDASRATLEQLGAPLDLYVFTHGQPSGILRALADLTGHAPIPADWLFGIQVSRHARLREFGTVEGIEAMIAKMDEHNFPWDAVIAEGWRAYDTASYEDLKRITDKVHGLGKKILLYEGCGRVPYSEDEEKNAGIIRALGVKPEYLVREPDGNARLPETATYNPADAPDPRRSQFLDLTNPDALAWWHGSVWGKLVRDIGVDGCKIDFCEQVPDHIPLVFADGRSGSGAHHWHPTLYNCLMYNFYQKHRPEGGMCFSRGGGIGAQRYPFLWAGDQLREFRFLQAIVTSILSSGLSGIPFMSYDMSGYMPARDLAENPEDRVFIRGAQMSCFSSNMQTHGIVTRPYDFEEPIRKIYRAYANAHQALRPYLVEQARLSCETGMPLLRHLFLYDPSDPAVLSIEDEYMLGCGLLVAPVLTNDLERDIYLPRGEWTDVLGGKTYSGNQWLRAYPVPFERVPVFILKGHASPALDGAIAEAAARMREA